MLAVGSIRRRRWKASYHQPKAARASAVSSMARLVSGDSTSASVPAHRAARLVLPLGRNPAKPHCEPSAFVTRAASSVNSAEGGVEVRGLQPGLPQ